MSSGKLPQQWKLVCNPPDGMRQRLEMAAQEEAKRRGCELRSITFQLLVPTLLNEAMDARGIPRPEVGE